MVALRCFGWSPEIIGGPLKCGQDFAAVNHGWTRADVDNRSKPHQKCQRSVDLGNNLADHYDSVRIWPDICDPVRVWPDISDPARVWPDICDSAGVWPGHLRPRARMARHLLPVGVWPRPRISFNIDDYHNLYPIVRLFDGSATITFSANTRACPMQSQISGHMRTGSQMSGHTRTGSQMSGHTHTRSEMSGHTRTGSEMSGHTRTGSQMSGHTHTGSEMSGHTRTESQIPGQTICGCRTAWSNSFEPPSQGANNFWL
jgi:hypothetical protein